MKVIAEAMFLLSFLLLASAATPTYGTIEIGEGVYRFRYEEHNTMFVVTPAGVVAFDPISSTVASHYAREIKRIAPGTALLAVVYSHHHEDHAGGVGVLQEAFSTSVPIIAHRNALAHMTGKASPDYLPPTLMFAERMDLAFGNRIIELHYLGRSHSDDMLVALVPDAQIAFVVDFANHDAVGFQDLRSFYFPDQFRALERLAALDYDTIIFGHGEIGDKSSIERQSDYYQALWAAVEQSCRAGKSEDEAVATVRLPKYAEWHGYDDWFPRNVSAVYRRIAKESPCR